MLFSKTFVHGVYVLCYLSRQEEDAVVPAGPIAEAMDVPSEQAAKILRALTHAGIVRSVRGRRGGYALAKAPKDISIASVVAAISPEDEDNNHFGSRQCPVLGDHECTVRPALLTLHQKMMRCLEEETLAPLIETQCELQGKPFQLGSRAPFSTSSSNGKTAQG